MLIICIIINIIILWSWPKEDLILYDIIYSYTVSCCDGCYWLILHKTLWLTHNLHTAGGTWETVRILIGRETIRVYSMSTLLSTISTLQYYLTITCSTWCCYTKPVLRLLTCLLMQLSNITNTSAYFYHLICAAAVHE